MTIRAVKKQTRSKQAGKSPLSWTGPSHGQQGPIKVKLCWSRINLVCLLSDLSLHNRDFSSALQWLGLCMIFGSRWPRHSIIVVLCHKAISNGGAITFDWSQWKESNAIMLVKRQCFEENMGKLASSQSESDRWRHITHSSAQEVSTLRHASICESIEKMSEIRRDSSLLSPYTFLLTDYITSWSLATIMNDFCPNKFTIITTGRKLREHDLVGRMKYISLVDYRFLGEIVGIR